MEKDEIYRRAVETADSKMDFYSHFISFLVVCSGLAAFNIYRSGELTWAKWAIMGWSVGIFFHWLEAFVKNKHYMAKMRDRLIEKEIQKLS